MLASPACFILFLLCQLTEYLSKPKVTVGLQNNNNGTCVTNLTCSTEEGEEDVTYSWMSLGQANNESYGGSILPISLRREKRDMTFICLARNPISSNSSNPIFAWKLCKEHHSRGKFAHTLFHRANTSKGGETPLTARVARHTRAIYL
uniref:Ig-like domain-containing protein n=1 Tax=Sus scrofa TaxID=9823 RepID=A0A8D0U7M6_PIG